MLQLMTAGFLPDGPGVHCSCNGESIHFKKFGKCNGGSSFLLNQLILPKMGEYHIIREISKSFLSTIFSNGSYSGNSLRRCLRSLVQFSLLLREFSIVFFASNFSL